jgi:pimeloyl-ACP methyl ester carboxylesterase
MRDNTRNGALSVTVVLLLTSLVGCGDWVPPPISPTYATILPANVQGERLLVVFTYGFGCSASGRGNGLRDAAEAVHARYPDAQVITRAWNDEDGIEHVINMHRGPVVLVGHSFGGCRSFEIASTVARPINCLILLDPVPTEGGLFRHDGKYFDLPSKVINAVCYYRAPGFFPISYPLVHPRTASDNRLRDLGHSEFCENAEVRQCIVDLCGREQTKMQFASGQLGASGAALVDQATVSLAEHPGE